MHAAGKAAGPALACLAGEQDAWSHPAQVLRQAIVVLGKHLPECPAARRLFLRLIVRYLSTAVQTPVFRQSVPAEGLKFSTTAWDGCRLLWGLNPSTLSLRDVVLRVQPLDTLILWVRSS